MMTNNDLAKLQTELSRRKFIKAATAGLATLSIPSSAVFAAALTKQTAAKLQSNPKIIWVLLRGALDSLHTVIPTFDQQYKALRPNLSSSFKGPLLPLEKGFALHPALTNLHQWYQEKSMLPIVAVSTGYQQRSHFDGQDYFESGKNNIDHDSGWLGRAVALKNKNALAIARTTPISLRSSDRVNAWYPSKFAGADDDIYDALAQLYQDDELLSKTLNNGREIKGLLPVKSLAAKKQQGKFIELSKNCAKLMTGPQGVDCAMLELGGWDTHNNQANRLEQKLSELDLGLAALQEGLADTWQNTVIIIGTEFGRTVKENGTSGTDHGNASTMLMAGGAVSGGKVLGNWPGLELHELYKERDLMPTSNSFAWIGNILASHWQLSEQELMAVFPHINVYNDALIVS